MTIEFPHNEEISGGREYRKRKEVDTTIHRQGNRRRADV